LENGQDRGTVRTNVEDASVRCEDSDENSHRHKHQNTDEDTKATSEEDSPQPHKLATEKKDDDGCSKIESEEVKS
jgi:hypothetical protein